MTAETPKAPSSDAEPVVPAKHARVWNGIHTILDEAGIEPVRTPEERTAHLRQVAHEIIDQLSPENLENALMVLNIPAGLEVKDRLAAQKF